MYQLTQRDRSSLWPRSAWPDTPGGWPPTQEPRGGDNIAMLTHDARNRLFVILNYVEILRERARVRSAPGDHVVLDSIASNCFALHSLITSCCNRLDIGAGPAALQRASIDLNRVLERVVQQFAPAAQQRKIGLTYNMTPAALPVDGDALALERVFANLVHNALKFTPAGGGVVVASRLSAAEAVVCVTDTGPGLAPEHARLLSGEARPTSPAAGACGLGLRIVRALVAAHDGRVDVSSRADAGTCVSVCLPLAADLDERPAE